MEEFNLFNLHRINPEIQQFYNCFYFNNQAALDPLLTSLINICGYQNHLLVNQNITIELINFGDELDKDTGAIETNTFAYYLENKIFLQYHNISQFSLKELKETLVHEVIPAKLDIVDGQDDNDPNFPGDLGHGPTFLKAARVLQRVFCKTIPSFQIHLRGIQNANQVKGLVLNHKYWSSRHRCPKHVINLQKRKSLAKFANIIKNNLKSCVVL